MDRYIKQIHFEGIGFKGQELLGKSRVLIVGCGALGTVVANSLARAGVGFLRIVDRDFVELSNLHRQILFDEDDASGIIPKAVVARQKLMKINSSITIEAWVKDVNSITIEKIVENIDLIIDCTDNFKTRYLINDIAFFKNIPWIYGGVIGSSGVVKSFIPGKGGCLRCMMETPPPSGSFATCDTAGVLNTITGIIGSLEANEALKYLTSNMDRLQEKMVYFDLWNNIIETFDLTQREDCPCCQGKQFVYLENKIPEAVHICGNNSIQVDPQNIETISLEQLCTRLKETGIDVNLTPFLLNIKAEGYEIKVFGDGRAIIKNAKTVEEAKGIYARYIGY